MTEQNISCTCNHSTFAGFHDADCPRLTKHVHEWKFRVDGHDEYFRCFNLPCEEILEVEQAESRLNATERLSANMAKALCRGMHPNFKAAIKALTAYANTLEGKDG